MASAWKSNREFMPRLVSRFGTASSSLRLFVVRETF